MITWWAPRWPESTVHAWMEGQDNPICGQHCRTRSRPIPRPEGYVRIRDAEDTFDGTNTVHACRKCERKADALAAREAMVASTPAAMVEAARGTDKDTLLHAFWLALSQGCLSDKAAAADMAVTYIDEARRKLGQRSTRDRKKRSTKLAHSSEPAQMAENKACAGRKDG